MRLPKIIRSQSSRRLAITSLLVLGLSPFFQLGQSAKSESSSFVKIKNRNWGKCLNLQSNATQNGGLPNVWDCVSHPDQDWKIEDAGNGFVKIKNRNWGKCLNLQSNATQNGGLPNVWDCVSHPDQDWKIEDAGNGFVKIKNRNWGKCLNLQSNATQNGGLPNVWDCVPHPDQDWKIENIAAKAQNFPLRGSQFDELGDHRHMETKFTLSNNGRLDADTRIWTDKQLKGFTGAVAIAVTDADGNILYVTEPHSYGVDCRRCPGSSDRTQHWTESIPSDVLGRVQSYAIWHDTNPRDRWRDWLSNAQEAAQKIRAIKKEFE